MSRNTAEAEQGVGENAVHWPAAHQALMKACLKLLEACRASETSPLEQAIEAIPFARLPPLSLDADLEHAATFKRFLRLQSVLG